MSSYFLPNIQHFFPSQM